MQWLTCWVGWNRNGEREVSLIQENRALTEKLEKIKEIIRDNDPETGKQLLQREK